MVIPRIKICNMLWEGDIKAETLYNDNPKPNKQLTFALESRIPIVIWIGEDELKNNKVKVKVNIDFLINIRCWR